MTISCFNKNELIFLSGRNNYRQKSSAKLIAAAEQKMRETYVPKKKKKRSEHVKRLERIRSKRAYEKKKKERNYFCFQCPHKSASEKAFEIHYIKVHNVSQAILKTDAWKEHLRGIPKE